MAGSTITSSRLTLRPWTVDDAEAAFEIYGRPEVARWLSPAMDAVPDAAAMRAVLQQWRAEDERLAPPAGRWAIELTETGRVIGGVILLYLPPGGEDLELGWQLVPDAWGQGYAVEAGHAVAQWAFAQHSVDEIFSVVRPTNERGGATAQRLGMEWVGETEKYYDLRLQVYRLRPAELAPLR
ncbi:GNAT family N-acetyltransferase [Nocardioides rotundus]|uniref:GNAT family N-acetyltransferase n=1 Tax=Nocardioides rotundus TaxID=1774216 RepID=UPI001CC1788D|nr:GNAT family N-acetyltransferase [Nocardioides rotundus]UAL29403.1 GNAT family N-acetyltransferase [Nocardioides rotundus]